MALFECRKVSSAKPVLLWTNENPTSNFNAQTINVDLTGYEALVIKAESRNSGNNRYQKTFYYDISNTNDIEIVMKTTSTATLQTLHCGRNFTVVSNGISVSACQNVGYTTTDNSAVIPLEIYGLKKLLI